jgi:hypothetical protein
MACPIAGPPGAVSERAVSERAVSERAMPVTQAPQKDSALALGNAEPRFDDGDIDWDAGPVLRTLGKMNKSLTWSEYSSGLSVDEKRGVYKFDCSGMVYWVLRKAAPRAAWWSAYGLEHRPLARDFHRRIARIAKGAEKGGWRRITKVEELVAGDVVAWIKPAVIRSPNTGHVAFVLLPPQRAPGYSNAYLLRIADSSRLLHDEDTRTDRDGFGFGTILLLSEPETGEPTGFGWVADKGAAFETQIALGRPEQ